MDRFLIIICTVIIYTIHSGAILDKTTDSKDIIPIIIATKLFKRGVDKIIIFSSIFSIL